MADSIRHETIGGTHKLTWQGADGEDRVYVTCSRITDHPRDGMRCETSWGVCEGKFPSPFDAGGPIYYGSVNMLSPQTKSTLANAIDARMPEVDFGIPWKFYVEQTMARVIEKYRQGEPIVKVGQLAPREGNKWLVYPFVLEGQTSLIYGPGGAAKSTVAVLCALLAQFGREHLKITATRQVNVLYLDWESDDQELDDRVKAVADGLGLADFGIVPEFLYRRMHQPLYNDIYEIQRIVQDENIGLLIVDSVGASLGGDINAADISVRLFNSIRTLGISALCIDHVSKGDNGENSPIGSVYKINEARNLWEFQVASEVGSDILELGLYHRKINQGKRLMPIGLELTYLEDLETGDTVSIEIHAKSLRDMNEGATKGLPAHIQIQHYLEAHGGKARIGEIIEGCSAKSDTIRRQLRRYTDMFVRLSDDKEKNPEWAMKVRDLYAEDVG